jgi:molybdopterin synthase catalytic subunit
MIEVKVTEQVLNEKDCLKFVEDNAAGGTVVFVGTVRNQTQGKRVERLEFEAYVPMAEKEMKKIAQTVEERWNALHVCMHHRVGVLNVGEIPVVISVSTPHRKAAFEACEYAINTLKETVPIWKKEVFEDGAVWVAAHP